MAGSVRVGTWKWTEAVRLGNSNSRRPNGLHSVSVALGVKIGRSLSRTMSTELESSIHWEYSTFGEIVYKTGI